MNLDFSAEPLFSWYVVLLIISGVAMIAIGAAGSLTTGWRVFNTLAGIGFIGYGIYLGFIFQGGSYIIFFKAFILPVLMIVNFFRSLGDRNKPATVPAPAPMQPSAPVQAQAPAQAQAAPAAPVAPAAPAAEQPQQG